MFNSSLLLRSVVIYAVCAATAILLGCVVANLDDIMSFYIGIALLGMLVVPMLLKWHHLWLIASWNTITVLFFLPGRPTIVLTLTFVSLGISILQHAINRKMTFVSAPSLALPLLVLLAVELVTAKLTGGLGLNILGSSEVGGKRYLFMLGGILGYFALAANRIPTHKAFFYVGTFYLCGASAIISDLAHFIRPSAAWDWIYLVFQAMNWWEGDTQQFVAGSQQIGRLAGIGAGGLATLSWMLAMYGIRGIFTFRKFWRMPLFLAAFIACLAGGYRATFVSFCLMFASVFVLEGLPKSRGLPAMLCGALLVLVGLLPFTDTLPVQMQRTLAVIPYINLNQAARDQAEDTSGWRERLWLNVLPQVPKHLLLGKGLSISSAELAQVSNFRSLNAEGEEAILASDYHSGPLSLIIPFGLGGTIAFLWLLFNGFRGLYFNYRYGEPELQRINTFLLAAFTARTILFMFVFGSFFGDLLHFTGILGLSMAVNGGIRKPVRVPARATGEIPLTRLPAHAMR